MASDIFPSVECDLSTIIVNRNTRDRLADTLIFLKRNGPSIPHEVFVLDSACMNGSAEMVKVRFPTVKLIRSARSPVYRAYGSQLSNEDIIEAYRQP